MDILRAQSNLVLQLKYTNVSAKRLFVSRCRYHLYEKSKSPAHNKNIACCVNNTLRFNTSSRIQQKFLFLFFLHYHLRQLGSASCTVHNSCNRSRIRCTNSSHGTCFPPRMYKLDTLDIHTHFMAIVTSLAYVITIFKS